MHISKVRSLLLPNRFCRDPQAQASCRTKEWCEAFGMRVNVGKCEVLYFHQDLEARKAMHVLGLYGLVTMSVKEATGHALKRLPWKERA